MSFEFGKNDCSNILERFLKNGHSKQTRQKVLKDVMSWDKRMNQVDWCRKLIDSESWLM